MLKLPTAGQMSRSQEARRLSVVRGPVQVSTASKLPWGWKVEPGPHGGRIITHPSKWYWAAAYWAGMVVAVLSWAVITPELVHAITSGDVGLAVGLSMVLLVLNAVVGAVIWMKHSLREKWRVGRNFLEVRDTSFDDDRVASFIGGKLMVVAKEPAEGGGYALRVVTVGRVQELFCMTKFRVPLSIGEFLAQETGWELHLPDELRHKRTSISSRTLQQGPPPGMGFEMELQDDGSLVLTRRPSGTQLGVGMVVGGVFCVVCGLVWGAAVIGAGGIQGLIGLLIFLTLGIGLVLGGLRPALAKEHWHLANDLLEIEERGIGYQKGVEYRGGSLTLVRLTGREVDKWHLIVIARAGQGSLLVDTTHEAPWALGQFVAECTGWRMQLPDDLKRKMSGQMPGQEQKSAW